MTYFGKIASGTPDWLLDAERYSRIAIVVAEANTQARAVLFCSQMVESFSCPSAFFEHAPKRRFSAYFGYQVETDYRLIPL